MATVAPDHWIRRAPTNWWRSVRFFRPRLGFPPWIKRAKGTPSISGGGGAHTRGTVPPPPSDATDEERYQHLITRELAAQEARYRDKAALEQRCEDERRKTDERNEIARRAARAENRPARIVGGICLVIGLILSLIANLS